MSALLTLRHQHPAFSSGDHQPGSRMVASPTCAKAAGIVFLGRPRPDLLHQGRDASQPRKPRKAVLQAAAREGRPTRDTLPRPPPHVRHPAAGQRRSSQARIRAPRTRDHSHDLEQLLALFALDGGSGSRSDGGRSRMRAGCGTVAVKHPGYRAVAVSTHCVLSAEQ